MTLLIVWMVIGYVFLLSLLTDVNFNQLDLLNSLVEKVTVVIFWPLFLLVLFLWRFCRADNDPGRPSL